MPRYTVISDKKFFYIRHLGKDLKTPAGSLYALPTEGLAQVVAAEWERQEEGKKIDPSQMPMTQFAATSIDLTSKDRSDAIAGLLAYIDSELLCHRADRPEDLAAAQEKTWKPFLDWCAERFKAPFQTRIGIMPVSQFNETRHHLKAALEEYDEFRLTGLKCAASTSGSLILALALAEGRATAEEIFQAAELDNSYQIERWGEDPAATKRRADIRREIEQIEAWFKLLT